MSASGLNAVVFHLAGAFTARSVYPPAHPKVREASGDVVDALRATLRERRKEELTFLVVGEDLVEGDRPMRQSTLYQESFLKALRRRGVERLTLGAATDEDELGVLLDGMSGADELRSTANVTLGRVRLELGDGEGDGEGFGPVTGLSEGDLDRIQGPFSGFRSNLRGSVEALDQVMWHFMEAFGRAERPLLLLNPLKSLSDRAFVHATNVALLALAQARSLGIQGLPLHDIGLAALLHDIGKIRLPPDLVNRVGQQMTPKEAALFRRHPELGAIELSGEPSVGPLPIIVAYEHHLRWDGEPSFPPLRRPRRPNFASQITAVADTWDVALAATPGARDRAEATARRVLRERAGTFLDPFLVGNFLRVLDLPRPSEATAG